MSNQTNNSSLPLAIIGLVLLAAIFGGFWLYSNSKTKPAANNSDKNAAMEAAALEKYRNAPPGAQPPNMHGSPTASVTVEEFADFQCPTCAGLYPKMKELVALYGNRIKFIYRSFPLQQIHKNAYEAAAAAEAAGLQGKFWEMENQLYSNQQTWANSDDAKKIFEDYAEKIGLDLAKFQNDAAGMIVRTRVEEELKRARAIGINGTPTVFINGRQLTPEQTEFNAMKQLIDVQLQNSGGEVPSNPAPTPAENSTPAAASSDAKKPTGNANIPAENVSKPQKK